jgi:antitoxin component HigA of HigAB toxin-antitoxin module
LFKAKFKFQNPIHQNHRHVVAVRELLDFLPQDVIKSVVVFSGDAEFKTEMPNGVFTLPILIDYLSSYTQEVLSMNRVQFSVGRIETARMEISEKTDVEHVKELHKRYGLKD